MRKTAIRLERMKLSEFQQISNEATLCGEDLNVQEA